MVRKERWIGMLMPNGEPVTGHVMFGRRLFLFTRSATYIRKRKALELVPPIDPGSIRHLARV